MLGRNLLAMDLMDGKSLGFLGHLHMENMALTFIHDWCLKEVSTLKV